MDGHPTHGDGTLVFHDDPRCLDAQHVGGKAAGLARARAAGFDVPPFLVVPRGGSLELAHLTRLGGGPYAVRSSARVEDAHGRSFAGQFETLLRVPAEGVAQAIERVRSSSLAEHVVAYAGGEDAGMSVLVMPMVEARAAGVAFSADPRTGARDVVVVEAVAGTAERLVSGELAPDRAVVADTVTRPGGSRPVLTDDEHRAVAAVARALEAHFGHPVDVEWALDGERLVVLQARPITALPAAPVRIPRYVPEGTWMRDDHHAVLSPLGYAWFLPYPRAMGDAMAGLGLPVKGVHARRIEGHLYLRFDMGGGDGPPPPAALLRLLCAVVPPLRALERKAEELLVGDGCMAVVDAWYGADRARFVARTAELARVPVARLGDDALRAHLREVLAYTEEGLVFHAQMGMGYGFALGALALFLEDVVGWPKARALEFTAGCSDATTAHHRALAALVRSHRDALRACGATSLAMRRVRVPAFGAAFAAFLETHGLRQLHYDPKYPSLCESESLLDALVTAALDDDAEPSRPDVEPLLREASAGLSPADSATLRRLVERARRAYGSRDDNGIECVSRPAALLRRAVLELGRRMGLEVPEHAVYLFPEEHDEALCGDRARLRAAIERRRGEESYAHAHRGPALYGPPPPPPPPFHAFPPHTRALLRIFDFMEQAEKPRAADGTKLVGAGLGVRVVEGIARVLHGPHELARVAPGDVVVCRITSPEWSIGLARAGALVTDEGGMLSHPAIIAREFGLPAVLGVGTATSTLRDGQRVRVDPVRGTVEACG